MKTDLGAFILYNTLYLSLSLHIDCFLFYRYGNNLLPVSFLETQRRLLADELLSETNCRITTSYTDFDATNHHSCCFNSRHCRHYDSSVVRASIAVVVAAVLERCW